MNTADFIWYTAQSTENKHNLNVAFFFIRIPKDAQFTYRPDILFALLLWWISFYLQLKVNTHSKYIFWKKNIYNVYNAYTGKQILCSKKKQQQQLN